VGKSTLFNALSNAGAESANYPFCTIEPNVGVVPVPDPRLTKLAELASSRQTVPASIEFVDIAGLVAGASKGEGLGNQFLAHIREVDAILHVVRCFENENIVHVSGKVDPAGDIEVIETELLLKDLETLEKRVDRQSKAVKSGDKKAKDELDFLQRLYAFLSEGRSARAFPVDETEQPLYRSLFLLTAKPVLFVANVAETDVASGNTYVEVVREIASSQNSQVVVISADIEAQVVELEPEERAMFLQELGVEESGLDRLIHSAYNLLGLMTYFTVGPKEARAWTIRKNTKGPQAAGVIHTDFERGFIRAETIKFDDYVRLGSEAAVREAGLMRSEGREYVVQDGDVLLFRFNV